MKPDIRGVEQVQDELCVAVCVGRPGRSLVRVGEAEQIKLVPSLIVFTVSSSQSVISTQTAICPNKWP